jgi:hypothetical protein
LVADSLHKIAHGRGSSKGADKRTSLRSTDLALK